MAVMCIEKERIEVSVFLPGFYNNGVNVEP